MVTATLPSRKSLAQFPLWLTRLHSWWFIGQVAANLLAAWFIIRLVSQMNWSELGLGLLVGQGFLLSVWLALGGLPNVMRFVSVFVVTLTAALALSDQGLTLWKWEEWADQTSQIFIICFFMVLLFHGLLLPLRWLLGFDIAIDAVIVRPLLADIERHRCQRVIE